MSFENVLADFFRLKLIMKTTTFAENVRYDSYDTYDKYDNNLNFNSNNNFDTNTFGREYDLDYYDTKKTLIAEDKLRWKKYLTKYFEAETGRKKTDLNQRFFLFEGCLTRKSQTWTKSLPIRGVTTNMKPPLSQNYVALFLADLSENHKRI